MMMSIIKENEGLAVAAPVRAVVNRKAVVVRSNKEVGG
eukprot:CAMPEP_0206377014 /NCGR_PEP_ID=MMETSP0294-20121207/9886_1 /ASSEMBLY_ACC=CAM_ASM_000327 /TAXON_ID=39354 /ORGANISM="Heterosigma akashiwo, Strain CCMP2393" /LENGTH=37 /DNA_ID= /DNA_START= /DNA_END= /DNA_ORIENTATION=